MKIFGIEFGFPAESVVPVVGIALGVLWCAVLTVSSFRARGGEGGAPVSDAPAPRPIGEWIEVGGRVLSIEPSVIVLGCDVDGADSVEQTIQLQFDPGDDDRLTALQPGQEVCSKGELVVATATHLALQHCQLR
ncbi:MAG TPA: hypothetical protein VGI86_15920 [Acidimicrobiia bacterium]